MFDGGSGAIDELADFVLAHPRLLVLTGAGISTASGIPDYRDEQGRWKQASPIQYRDFVHSPLARQRYWARSAIGWPRFRTALPGPAHHALAALQHQGHVSDLVTQNVDGLHQRAGSEGVIDLHGRLDRIVCLDCGERSLRQSLQTWLLEHNPQLAAAEASPAPDGDALLEDIDFTAIKTPVCPQCAGLLKPDVVFFGENVPAARVARSFEAVEKADAMLVVGSSLMVYSGFRFARRAHERSIPIIAINRGVTRADELLSRKLEMDCGQVLSTLADRL